MLQRAGHHRGVIIDLVAVTPLDTEPRGSLAQPDKLSWYFQQGEDREVAKTDEVEKKPNKKTHEGNRWWNVWQPDCFIPHSIQSQSEIVYVKTMKWCLIRKQGG